MARRLARIKKYRNRFGWVFLVSIAILFVSTMAWLWALILVDSPAPNPTPSPPPLPESETDSISLAMLISVASLLTSLTSLVGFFFTTALAWRRERREQTHADVELEKKKLEVEKLRQDLVHNKENTTPTTGGKSD